MSNEQDPHPNEPEEFRLLQLENFKTHALGDKEYEVGFCVNSPSGAGYCDGEVLWIADCIIDGERIVEICVHESLHAIFPELEEEVVEKYGKQIGSLIAKAFKAKKRPLPDLPSLLTEDNVGQLFPGAKLVTEREGIVLMLEEFARRDTEAGNTQRIQTLEDLIKIIRFGEHKKYMPQVEGD